MKNYADRKATEAKTDAINDAVSKYATINALQDLKNRVDTLDTNTSNTYAKVYVQAGTPSGAKTGDIWVTV